MKNGETLTMGTMAEVDYAALALEWTKEGDWIQTYTGRSVNPLDLLPADISIIDIAHALSNLCRFAGHTKRFYSVAEHSYRISFLGDQTTALWKLLHDAPEAYLIDLPRPLKRSKVLGDVYKFAERMAERAIAQRFNLPIEMPAEVKRWDDTMLFTEQRDLMGRAPKPWKDPVPPLDQRIEPISPHEAEMDFLFRYCQITGEKYADLR